MFLSQSWSQSIAAASRWESKKRPGTGERATGGRQEMRTARATSGGAVDSAATARRTYGRTGVRWGGRQRCICQVVGDGQVVRRQTYDDRTVGRMSFIIIQTAVRRCGR